MGLFSVINYGYFIVFVCCFIKEFLGCVFLFKVLYVFAQNSLTVYSLLQRHSAAFVQSLGSINESEGFNNLPWLSNGCAATSSEAEGFCHQALRHSKQFLLGSSQNTVR